jgi:hypothetical protein
MQCVDDENSNSEEIEENDDTDEEECGQNLNKFEHPTDESNLNAPSLHYEKLSVPVKNSMQNSSVNQHNNNSSTKKIDHRLILDGVSGSSNDEYFSEYADMSSISTLEPLSINTNFTCSINNEKSPRLELTYLHFRIFL